jgi:predicted permease
MESVLRDLRLAVRGLGRNPGFSIVAIVTLALGIGATTSVFSVVYGVVLRPLPFPSADRLAQIVQVMDAEANGETHRGGLTPDQFLNLQEHATTLEAVGIFGAHAQRTLTGIPIPARLYGAGVSAELFNGLGVEPARGRTLRPEDAVQGAEPVVVLSHRAWRVYLGGREDIIDSRITFDDTPTRVVGVMPEGFGFPSLASASMSRNSAGELEDAPEFWVPLAGFARTPSGDGFSMFQAYAIVTPGVRHDRALAEVRSLIGPLPNQKVLPVELVNARIEIARDTSRALAIFQLGVVFVLLIACVNVVNLLLTRAAGRRRELAVRVALGAGRGRIVREGIAEAVVLSVAGGSLGCLLAYGLTTVLRTLPPHVLPRLRDIEVDGVVLSFALGLSVITGLSVGLFAALRVATASVLSQLRPQTFSGWAAIAAGRIRPSSILVVAEVAVAMVLLTGGGLLVTSFVRMVRTDLGYDPRDVVSLEVALPKARYGTSEAHERFYRDFASGLRHLPRIESVAASDYSMAGSPIGFYPLTIDGRPAGGKSEIHYRRVSPDYFRTLRIPVVEGREFRDDDWTPAAAKVIVNQSFARRHFPGTSAIGHRLQWSEWAALEVIGVVADTQGRPDAESGRTLYLPIDAGGFSSSMTMFVRSEREPADVLAAARSELARIDRQLAPHDAAGLEEVLSHSAASPRLYGFVALWCALLALALSAIGLYGVLAYSVGSRTHEFGVRIALGAEPRAVRWQVLRHGLALSAVGLALGLAGSYVASQTLSSLLFGVTPRDLTTFAAAAGLLLATAAAACLIPSSRATRVDPIAALRAE